MNRFLLLLAASIGAATSCSACGFASSVPGDTINITDESALIVWNSKTRVEQFVRRASFETKAKDFGFLVPTPSKPELSANRDSLFDDLEFELLPKTKVVTRRGVDWKPLLSLFFETREEMVGASSAAANSAASPSFKNAVEVVEQKRVGDYNATVLRAGDTRSLTKWLTSHHYAVSSDTRDWLAPYVKRGFFITAFQIAALNSNSAQAKAVRLSFKTDAPFYPYRESKLARKIGGGRTLRVFFVGDGRVEGRIENENKRSNWPAPMTYSAPLGANTLRAQDLDVPPGALRLTAFEDVSSPRPGWGDLKFSPSREQSEKTPPPHIVQQDKRAWIPLDAVALLGVLAVGMVRRKREHS